MGIFKPYDIRGVYPTEINEKIFYKIARSCVRYFGGRKVLIGGDGRLSTPSLKKALIEGLIDEGMEVYDLGLVPTSTFNFLISSGKFDFGLQVTASHNPKEFNGIKVYDNVGNSIGIGYGLEKIEEIFKNFSDDSKTKKGVYIDASEMKLEHKKFLEKNLETFDKKVCIDYSNGCGSIVFSDLIRGKIDAMEVNKEVDGNFPSHPPEPNEENLRNFTRLIKENECVFGAAFDGDADRIVFVDENGKIIRGDKILYLLSKFLKAKKIVHEVSFPPFFKKMMREIGSEVIETRVGRTYIINEMRNNKADVGGEISSHFYFKETNFMEDAFYTFLIAIKILKKEKKTFGELLKDYPDLPSKNLKIEVPEEKKYQIVENIRKELKDKFDIISIDGVKVIINEKNWFLIRASNTEPVIRVYIEGENQEKLREVEKLITSFINRFI
jgi:phosphomannomutase